MNRIRLLDYFVEEFDDRVYDVVGTFLAHVGHLEYTLGKKLEPEEVYDAWWVFTIGDNPDIQDTFSADQPDDEEFVPMLYSWINRSRDKDGVISGSCSNGRDAPDCIVEIVARGIAYTLLLGKYLGKFTESRIDRKKYAELRERNKKKGERDETER